MSDRLSRSNSQTNLPNYGQGQHEDKNRDVGNDKSGASAKLDKDTGQAHSEKNDTPPQMRSKEGKKDKEPSDSDSDDRGESSGAFGRLFLGAKPSQAARNFKNDEDSSSEDDVMSHQNKVPQSPRQQQSDSKEKNSNKKVPKLSLENLGNALKSLASDRREMTISPRKNPKDTQRTGKDSNTGLTDRSTRQAKTTNTLGTTTTTTNTTTTTTTTTTTQPNPRLAIDTAGISRTLTTRNPSGWLPSSPRLEAHSPGRSNSPSSEATGVTTTTNTGTTTNTPTGNDMATPVASSKQATVNQTAEKKPPITSGPVKAALLPLRVIATIHALRQGQSVTGDQIAELLVYVESRAYTLPLEEGRVNTILRGGMTVEELDDPADPGKKLKVNIIELVSETLINKHLNAKEVREFVATIATQYKEIAKKFTQEIKDASIKDLRKNELFVKLMKPLVNNFVEKFFGSEMKLSSSGFSPEFQNFLQGIDTRIIEWAKASEDVDPGLLFRARKSAIAAYIATRALTVIMREQLVTDKNYESDHLKILNGYLNTFLTTQTDQFYFDIMSRAKNQDNDQKTLLQAHMKASALKQDDDSLKSRREHLREKSDTNTPISPRKEKLEKSSSHLEALRSNKRLQEINDFYRDSKIKIRDADFTRYFRDHLISTTRENFKEFKNNGAEYMLKALNKYIADNLQKFKNDGKLLVAMKKQLQDRVDQKNVAPLVAQLQSSATTVTTTTVVATPIQTAQVTDSTLPLASQPLKAEAKNEEVKNDSSTSLDELKLEDPTKSPFDDGLSTDEQVTEKNKDETSRPSEEVTLEELKKSPFDNSETSGSQ